MNQRARRDLRAISADGIAFSLMVGLGETYIPAFALALGMGEVAAGWVVALPLLAGALLQLVSPVAVRRLRSHRRWVVACALIQAVSLLAFFIGGAVGALPTSLVFIIAAIYWGAGLATGPAWNTWVGTLVPRRLRSRFFARRSRLAQAAVLLGIILGGLALQFGDHHGKRMMIFAILFAAAAMFRFISAGLLAAQREPEPMPPHHRHVSTGEWIRRAPRTSSGRLLLYMLAVQAAVQISGPFFTPYMLRQLDFSYAQYLTIIATAFAAKMIVLPTVGGLVQRFGSQRLLYVAGFGIVPTAALWTISDSFGFLICVQLLSGSVWAIYELTTFLLLFDHIPEHERTSVLTTYNLAHAIATVGGALAGGFLLTHLGLERTGYHMLFILSTVGRLCAVPLLLRIRETSFAPGQQIAIRPIGVRPNLGSLDAPIVTSLRQPERRSGRE